MPEIQGADSLVDICNRHLSGTLGTLQKKKIVIGVDADVGRIRHSDSRECARAARRACGRRVGITERSLDSPRSEIGEVVGAAWFVGSVYDPEAVNCKRRRGGKGWINAVDSAAGINLLDLAISDVGDVENVATIDGEIGGAADGSGTGGKRSGNGGDLGWCKADHWLVAEAA